ncbi:kelch repeat and BTB domain-containing protein 11 [Scyliorhinus canicula]|uniref:kelch repeat and BTB domain-containing protein 11 n=1 Tax=Scyliorhinus canicula TaxID=7830 RepID=UPI0018F2ADC0|nr:kelch repeat and BTB domain-containing protein 11 [Scyliorhinus canicula]
MEFAGKAIVSAAFVVTLTLIYRYYKLRAVNAAQSRVPESPDARESGEKDHKDTGQEILPLLSSQTVNSEQNIHNATGHIVADQFSNKPDSKTQSVDRTADDGDKETETLRTPDELNNGRGVAKTNQQKAKVRRLGVSKPVRNRLAVKGLTEPQVKAPTLNTTTASINGECAVKSIQAEECDKLDLNNKSSESAGVYRKSCENIIIVAKQDCSNNVSSQTYFEQELDVCSNGESQLGQNNCSFDVLSAADGTKKIYLPAIFTETQDHLVSPASNAIKCAQDKLVEKQPTELTENEMLEGLINWQNTAGSSGEHENITSACKIYPEIKIPRSNTPSVQSTYQVKHEKAKAGNESEGELNVLQFSAEANLSDHKIISTSEMASEGKEDRDKSDTCSMTQITKDPASPAVDSFKVPAFQCQVRDQRNTYCCLSSGQGTRVPSQSMTVKTKVVESPVPDSNPSEHPKTSNISSEAPSCPTKSAIQTTIDERTVLRKDSISAIAETPAFLIGFHSETREFSERGHSSQLNSRTPSVDDLSSSSLGSLVDSLYLSQPDLSKETPVEVVARANFIQIPLNNQSTVEVMKCRLDLGNCYEILCVAKKHNLKDLQDAAYQVMSDNYLQVLKNPNIYGQLKADERELILTRRMYGRTYFMVADVDVQENVWAKTTVQPSTEGQSTARPQKPSQTNHKLYYYKEENDSWYPLVNMTFESISKDCALCTMFNYLFVVAGCQGIGKEIKLSNKVFCYNPVTNIWSEIMALNQARPNCKLVALDGYLYAIGGECLSTVERYDPRIDRWTFTAPLPQGTFTITHKATVCNGEIYLTRGTFYHQLLKYNAREDTWNVCAMMSRKDKTADIAAVKNFIYRFEINQHFGISVYRYHIITKVGEECATKRLCNLAPFQCVVMDDTIYCINKQFLMQFVAHEVSPCFRAEDCTALPGAKGVLFPFVLTLPERDSLQTRV